MKRLELKPRNEIGDREAEIARQFHKDFFELLEKSEYDINSYVQEDEIVMEDGEKGKLLQEMLENIVVVNSCCDLEQFWTDLEKKDYYKGIDQFIDWLKQYTESASYPWESISFIRELGMDELQELVSYCFYKHVLVNNKWPAFYGKYTREQLYVVVKVFFTLIDMNIVNNLSDDYTQEKAYKLFIWEDDVFLTFWELIDKNREILWKNAVIQKLDKILDSKE